MGTYTLAKVPKNREDRMRFLLLVIFLVSCGSSQDQGEAQHGLMPTPGWGDVGVDEGIRPERAGSRLPPAQDRLEVIVPCNERIDECVRQEEYLREILGEAAEECFERVDRGIYNFRVVTRRTGNEYNTHRPITPEVLRCLSPYLERVPNNQLFEFSIRWSPSI